MCKPPAAHARANTFADESTPLPCGPPIIQERSFTLAAEGLIGSCRPYAQRREPSWEFSNSPCAQRDAPDDGPSASSMAPHDPNTKRGTQEHLIKPFLQIPRHGIRSRHFLWRALRRRAHFRRTTAWQHQLLHEPLHELEAVAERHLTDAGDLRDRLLRAALAARQGREVNRGRRRTRGRQGHRAVDLLEFFENLLRLGLDRVRQTKP